MSNLTPAQDMALDNLTRTHGRELALVVQAVMEYKLNLDLFEQAMNASKMNKELRDQLLTAFVDQISDSVATMCGLIGKSFKQEVMPLVLSVNDEASRTSARHLQ